MGKKLAQSLLLMAMVAVMMIGGGMVEEGRREMWVDTNSGFSLALNQDSVTGSKENAVQQIADIISDEVLIRAKACPQAHRNF